MFFYRAKDGSAAQPPDRIISAAASPARGCSRLPLFSAPSRLLLVLLTLLPLALLPAAGEAQWPGSIAGQVVDSRSGMGISAVLLELDAAGEHLRTDGSGGFRSRGMDAGKYRLTIRHFGYQERVAEIEVRNGEVVRILLELEPVVLDVEGVVVLGEGSPPLEAGVFRIGREWITRSSARTAGDVVAELPGVVLRQRGSGGAQTVSIRGSGSGAVLVLLDGIPLNDPVTGEADLSTLSAAAIEDATLYRGGRSARFGPRAQGGAVLLRSRVPSDRADMKAAAGSLGERTLGGSGGGGDLLRWGVGGEAREVAGSFRFLNPAGYGGADGEVAPEERRVNSDVSQHLLRGSLEAAPLGGTLKLHSGYDFVDRGVPGRSFAPSREARQSVRRGRASLSWRRGSGADATSPRKAELSLFSVLQESRSEDRAPPFGHSYDDRSRILTTGLRAEVGATPASSRWLDLGGGFDVQSQSVRSDVLTADGASGGRWDVGLFLRNRVRAHFGGFSPELSIVVRQHRDGASAGWHPGHEVTLSAPAGPFTLHLAHRSSFTPPALADLFFREGVGIAPNPDLRSERVPGEWEVGFSSHRSGPTSALAFGADFFTGDVRDMIVWAPDFRFVWSPRNVNVNRAGAEGWGEIRLVRAGLHAKGSYSYARMTYDRPDARPGREADVQLAYRPRHSGAIAAGWDAGPWSTGLNGRFTGSRNPVPSEINRMPAFWSIGGSLSRSLLVQEWRIQPTLRVDRLFDEKDSLIFGYPDPGRTFSLEVRVLPMR